MVYVWEIVLMNCSLSFLVGRFDLVLLQRKESGRTTGMSTLNEC